MDFKSGKSSMKSFAFESYYTITIVLVYFSILVEVGVVVKGELF